MIIILSKSSIHSSKICLTAGKRSCRFFVCSLVSAVEYYDYRRAARPPFPRICAQATKSSFVITLSRHNPLVPTAVQRRLSLWFLVSPAAPCGVRRSDTAVSFTPDLHDCCTGLLSPKEANKPEQHFFGFDIEDEVLIIIENKKNWVKMELSKETGEAMEVEEPSIVNKKKHSISSISSPELNDVKNNRSDKRHKKDNFHSDALESLELQVTPTLGISESMNASSSKPEYISEDCQAIQSSASPKVSSQKLEKIDINNTINKRRNSEIATPFASTPSFNCMIQSLEHVFKYLKTHELLSASRVCTAWHTIAMNKLLWRKVCLKDCMVYDWERFVDTINQQRTDTLNTRRMLRPSKVEDLESFWLRFANAMKRAKQLKCIELYRCPVLVVEDIIYSLPQIEVLNATSIRNPNFMKEIKTPNDLMYLNLSHLGQMTKLTELRLKGLTGIKLTALPSFENLINLNRFSLTSIKEFPKEIYQRLNTITDTIEFLEIGDCKYLTKDFAVSLKRFINLKTLRLENCCNGWDQSAHDVFTVIRGLKKLNVLELVNIELSKCVKEELEKCDSIKAFLIIPKYKDRIGTAIYHVVDCLEKLSKTLTHLVWLFPHDVVRVAEIFINTFRKMRTYYTLKSSHTKETTNNIPELRTREPRQRPGDEGTAEKEKDKSDGSVDKLTLDDLWKMLNTMMPDAKIKIFTVPSYRTNVYLNELFNDL
ncbi:unnamed protein product [Macrosiphum euphorbiae]|uniref:F-box domain-containing protein n=1 Tax=Macrosiphum euphorbiae TaxID=13131 RepID=A0AAV0XXM0_9HEMI|nr:unnamed protein product [Macrosiphum euphorbiae]